MGRTLRPDRPGGWHHVVNRGVDHQPIFFDDSDRVDFGRLLGVGHDRFGVEVHAYCLMTNHFHLLVHCPCGGLSGFMHDVTATFTRHVNDRLGRDGSLVRGRFRSFTVDSDAYVLCVTRYIHRTRSTSPMCMTSRRTGGPAIARTSAIAADRAGSAPIT